MIVYGDPSYEEDFPTLLRYLHGCITLSSGLGFRGLDALERLRWLLIFAGQIQQGLEDALDVGALLAAPSPIIAPSPDLAPPPAEDLSLLDAMRAVTERLANAFVAAGQREIDVGAMLGLLAKLIPNWETAPHMRLTLKVPEGYAFYALYPEQYGAAAQQWAREHAGDTISTVRVIGIRSIGASLAAMVRASLESAGFNATWQTVRPTGHPFERHTNLGNIEIAPDEWALIVDEGPGQSGSSMASVAQGLVALGLPRNRIAFLPGHGGDPGGSGGETVRQWWADTPRYVTPTADLRWNRLALPDVLAAQTPRLLREYAENSPQPPAPSPKKAWEKGSDLFSGVGVNIFRRNYAEYRQSEGELGESVCGEEVHVVSVEDFGGGLWRQAVYENEAEWPAVCAAFERPKYRVTLSKGTRVLWKYAGLATIPLPNPPISPTPKREGWISQSHVMEQWLGMRGMFASPLPPTPLGAIMGFVATLWIEGTPLTLADATPELSAEIGAYIGACSAPPPTLEEHAAALARLQSLLYWNTWEALGEEAAEQTRQWSAVLEQSAWARQARTFGDGHLAPQEWIRAPDGRLHKTDCIGYEPDHTIIGRQAYAWDIAGAIVEWRLEAAASAFLLEAAQTAIQGLTPNSAGFDANIPPDVLTAYQLAYAAFRAGQTHLCANMSGHNPAEQARLWSAYNFYKETLARLLQI